MRCGLFEPVDKSLCLEHLCCANYQRLLRLAPDLAALRGVAVGTAPRGGGLYLAIIDRSAHTLTARLGQQTAAHGGQPPPQVTIRVYLDLRLAEALSDHDRQAVAQAFSHFGVSKAILDYKWRLNYFLHKWLEHCLQQRYQFQAQAPCVYACT